MVLAKQRRTQNRTFIEQQLAEQRSGRNRENFRSVAPGNTCVGGLFGHLHRQSLCFGSVLFGLRGPPGAKNNVGTEPCCSSALSPDSGCQTDPVLEAEPYHSPGGLHRMVKCGTGPQEVPLTPAGLQEICSSPPAGGTDVGPLQFSPSCSFKHGRHSNTVRIPRCSDSDVWLTGERERLCFFSINSDLHEAASQKPQGSKN